MSRCRGVESERRKTRVPSVVTISMSFFRSDRLMPAVWREQAKKTKLKNKSSEAVFIESKYIVVLEIKQDMIF